MIRPERYEQHPGLSQSDLLLFERDIREFYLQKIVGEPRVEEQKDAFDLGSLIDAILLDPAALAGYYITGGDKIKPKERACVDILWNMVHADYEFKQNQYKSRIIEEEPLFPVEMASIDSGLILKACTAAEYYPSYKVETKLERIRACQGYWSDCIAAQGKVKVSTDIWTLAQTICEELKDDEYTGDIFRWLKGDHPDHIRVIKQAELYGEWDGVPIKGMVDFFIMDEALLTIDPWDLKTSKNLKQYRRNYAASRYGRQGSMYSELIKQNFPQYKMNPFGNLVIPTEIRKQRRGDIRKMQPIGIPERFIMTPQEMFLYENGGVTAAGVRIKGWKELIEDYLWHRNHGFWNHTREYYMNGGFNKLETNTLSDSLEIISEEEPELF